MLRQKGGDPRTALAELRRDDGPRRAVGRLPDCRSPRIIARPSAHWMSDTAQQATAAITRGERDANANA
jgi:hypothetical protein